MELLYVLAAVVIVVLVAQHRRRAIALIPESWTGKGQLLFLALLWSVVFINAIHVLPRWTPERLITEWVITANALLTTLVVMGAHPAAVQLVEERQRSYPRLVRAAVAWGFVGFVLVVATGYGVRRAFFGDGLPGHVAQDQIRFGPKNTNHIK